MKKINIEKIVNYIFIISSIIIVINLIIFSIKDKFFDIKNISIQNNKFIDKKCNQKIKRNASLENIA